MNYPKDRKRRTLEARFFEKTKIQEGCWLWIGYKLPKGYGMIHLNGKPCPAHRVSHLIFKGAIPTGLEIDHLCRNKSCVNPNHLEAVTRSVNLMRGDNHWRRKTHCPQGHPYDMENTLIDKRGARNCLTCVRYKNREYRRKIKGYYDRHPNQKETQ